MELRNPDDELERARGRARNVAVVGPDGLAGEQSGMERFCEMKAMQDSPAALVLAQKSFAANAGASDAGAAGSNPVVSLKPVHVALMRAEF